MATADNNNAQLDATIDALGQGLSEAKSGASTNIHNWIGTLNSSSDQALKKLAGDLQQLESMLGQGNPDGSKIGQLLSTIGQQTTAAAGRAEGTTSEKIRELGRQLSDAANSMASK